MLGRKTLEMWVGLFVAAGLLALTMLAFKVGNLGAATVTNGYQITAEFDDIGGLKVKAAVTMSGVGIGRVTRIYIDHKNYRAVVVMDIDGKYDNIPVDSSASILTAGLLGDQYVGIEPGGSDQYLQNGGRLTITQSALVLEKMISQFLFNKAATPSPGN